MNTGETCYNVVQNSLESMDIDDISRNYYLADWKYEKIMQEIREFEAKLDNNHEIAIFLASFGATKLMAVHEISYQNPDILYFYGTVDNKDAQLIQHMTQLNFLLTAVEKPDPNVPPRRIGFVAPTED